MRKHIIIFTLFALFLIGCSSATDDSMSETIDSTIEVAEESAESVEYEALEEASVDPAGDDFGEADVAMEDAAEMAAVSGAADAEAGALLEKASEETSEDHDDTIIFEPEPPAQPPVQSGLLTAGDVDDNLNYDFFLGYIQRMQRDYGQNYLPTADLTDRITLEILGSNQAGIPNAKLVFSEDGNPRHVYANSQGIVHLFPGMDRFARGDVLNFTVIDPVTNNATNISLDITQADETGIYRISLDDAQGQRTAALDVALVIDVTGSMGDELQYLTAEFESIVSGLKAEYRDVDMRFALVVYRDEGDLFVTQAYDFTSDVQEMRAYLSEQTADGGGDYPEAMDEALIHATELDWRDGDVARVLILNADAPPHDRNLERTLRASSFARDRGIRIYSLAASGVADTAEYIMRVMAATTGGRHMFLTDDSGVGNSHQEPKTPCYVVTRLDQLIFRVLSSELSGTRIEPQASDIIREVGNYDSGVCLDRGQE